MGRSPWLKGRKGSLGVGATTLGRLNASQELSPWVVVLWGIQTKVYDTGEERVKNPGAMAGEGKRDINWITGARLDSFSQPSRGRGDRGKFDPGPARKKLGSSTPPAAAKQHR